jgi:hypothetical protein
MKIYERGEVEEAYRNFVAVGDSADWNAWADLHTVDGVCVECHLGTFEGREAIRAGILKVMAAAPPDMFFPTPWHVIEGNRVVFYPIQALPDPNGGNEKYEFSCVTILDYAGNGEFSYQEDVYNPRAGEQTFKRWIAAGGMLPTNSDLLG